MITESADLVKPRVPCILHVLPRPCGRGIYEPMETQLEGHGVRMRSIVIPREAVLTF